MRAADLGDRLGERVAVGQQVGDAGRLVGQRQQEVVGGDVLVAERRGISFSARWSVVDERLGRARTSGSSSPLTRGQRLDRGPGALADRRDVGRRRLPQEPAREPVLLLEQRERAGAPAPARGCAAPAASRCAAATASWALIVNRSACMRCQAYRIRRSL